MELNVERVAERAAFYLGDLNTIHSLRNGNGRNQREFIRMLGLRAGQKVRWAPFSKFEIVSDTKL